MTLAIQWTLALAVQAVQRNKLAGDLKLQVYILPKMKRPIVGPKQASKAGLKRHSWTWSPFFKISGINNQWRYEKYIAIAITHPTTIQIKTRPVSPILNP